MKPLVVRIPSWVRYVMAQMPRWKETLGSGTRIARHTHNFLAVYFAFGASCLDTEDGLRPLPPAAMVIVPSRIIHGWHAHETHTDGTIGHFHIGHPVHVMEPGQAIGS